MPGIQNFYSVAAAFAKVNNTLANVPELVAAIGAGQRAHVRLYLPITLAGTAGGAAFFLTIPAAPASFVQTNILIDLTTATPVFFAGSTVTTSAAFGATLNVAGNHVALIETTFVNGATAGNIQLQFAQNVTNASASTLLIGAYMAVTLF